MRVAMILEQAVGPIPGGTGRYARETAGAVARVPGVVVSGWTSWHRELAAAAVPGVDGPHRLPLPRRPLTLAWERGRGPAPARADLVHAPTLLAPPRRRVPLVVTIHDAVPWTHPETLTPRGVRWHRAMAARAADEADAVVVPTSAVERALRRHVALERVVVVGEGPREPAEMTEVDAAEVRRRLALPADGYLLTIATLEPRKGLDVLLAALARPEAPDLPLLIVGQGGWGGVDLAGMASALGMGADRVRALGRLSDDQLDVVLRGATALVVPSRSEGFGLPLLEGMAVGVPVVTSDAPALVEVGGGAARTAPVGDEAALAGVLAEVVAGTDRQRMISDGLRRAADFSWERSAAELAALYRTLG